MTLGQKIVQLRKDHQMSQEELAERMDVSRQAVSKWENDLSRPGTDHLIMLAQLFEVDMNTLVDCEKEEEETRKQRRRTGILAALLAVAVCLAAVFGTMWQIEQRAHNKTAQLLEEVRQTTYWDSVTMTQGLLHKQVDLTDDQKVQISQLIWSQDFTPWSEADDDRELLMGGYLFNVEFRQDGICYHWTFTPNAFTYTVTTQNGDSVSYKYSPNYDFIEMLANRFVSQ